jgi:hypothetical protein
VFMLCMPRLAFACKANTCIMAHSVHMNTYFPACHQERPRAQRPCAGDASLTRAHATHRRLARSPKGVCSTLRQPTNSSKAATACACTHGGVWHGGRRRARRSAQHARRAQAARDGTCVWASRKLGPLAAHKYPYRYDKRCAFVARPSLSRACSCGSPSRHMVCNVCWYRRQPTDHFIRSVPLQLARPVLDDPTISNSKDWKASYIQFVQITHEFVHLHFGSQILATMCHNARTVQMNIDAY